MDVRAPFTQQLNQAAALVSSRREADAKAAVQRVYEPRPSRQFGSSA